MGRAPCCDDEGLKRGPWWSAMATRLPGRTDNQIKNHWNTHLRKKLLRMGVDPVTHRPREDLGLLANFLAAANLENLGEALWRDALKVQVDAAQAARIHLLQRVVQAITSNTPPPSMDMTGLFGLSAAWLCNQQSGTGDLLQGVPPPLGLLNSSLPYITSGTSGPFPGLIRIPLVPSDVQLPEWSLALREEGGGAVSLPPPDVSSPSAGFPVASDNSLISENQVTSTCVTAASSPLASASPLKNHTIDSFQDIIAPSDAAAEVFEPWGVLARDCDYHWEDLLG
ncbi:hypothetical protein Taro_050481 [Colocasia esculenta]|uniref:Uncharacterized protein n=1 Tax=Colocasia esculenta TaxID=4460 RepID=A0A843XE04_COLES|nr:hypothetical protein [Colocasia esculenta]